MATSAPLCFLNEQASSLKRRLPPPPKHPVASLNYHVKEMFHDVLKK